MFPAEIQISKKNSITLPADEGVMPSTKEGLTGLRPVLPDGVYTFGSQTHPADGNCGITVTTREHAKELSADPTVDIQIVSYGYARAKKGLMAMAMVPAVKMALQKAGLGIEQMKAIKTHNPFAANDIYMADQIVTYDPQIQRHETAFKAELPGTSVKKSFDHCRLKQVGLWRAGINVSRSLPPLLSITHIRFISKSRF